MRLRVPVISVQRSCLFGQHLSFVSCLVSAVLIASAVRTLPSFRMCQALKAVRSNPIFHVRSIFAFLRRKVLS